MCFVCHLVLNVSFVLAVSYLFLICFINSFSGFIHLFYPCAYVMPVLCLFYLFLNINFINIKFWGTKHINQITCPPTSSKENVIT